MIFFLVTLPLGNPGVAKSVAIAFQDGSAGGCVPVVGETYENANNAIAAAGGAGPKGAKKAGPKKLANKQLAGVGVVPPRSASTSSILPSAPPASANAALPYSPALSRPMPAGPGVAAAAASSPVPPRPAQAGAKVPPPPDRNSKVLAFDPPASQPPPSEEPKSKLRRKKKTRERKLTFVLFAKRYASPALLPVRMCHPFFVPSSHFGVFVDSGQGQASFGRSLWQAGDAGAVAPLHRSSLHPAERFARRS